MEKSTKERIESEQVILETQRKEEHVLEKRIIDTMDKLNLLYVKLILEEGLINEIKWSVNLRIVGGSLSSFRLIGDINKAKAIKEILKPDYHCSFEMIPGVRLIFDDSEMSIAFNDLQIGLSFILKYSINIDTKPITEQISSLQNSIDTIKKFEDQLQGKKIES